MNNLFDENFIWIGDKSSSTNELFTEMSETLMKKGMVKEGYLQALLEREKNYPTGLALEHGLNIGIPHADFELIHHEFIAVAVLEKPIKMNKMEDMSTEIEVSIVFLLGLQDASKHLEILKRFIKLIQDESILRQIKNAENGITISDLLKKEWKN